MWLDAVVLFYGLFIVGLITITAPLVVKYRNEPIMRALSPGILVIMCFGAIMHIAAEIIGNRHFPLLTSIELKSCVLFGYWMPYALGAGIFYMALYLRLFTYTTGVSVWCSARTAAKMRFRLRFVIVIATLAPILMLSLLSATRSGLVDIVGGQCVSDPTLKIAVGAWFVICLIIQFISVIVFRSGFAGDIVGEARKQCFISIMGGIVVMAQLFVIVFASDGLGNPINRAVATFSVATLYAWSIGVMAMHPLYTVISGGTGYERLLNANINVMEHPVTSVRLVYENAKERDSARVLVADFLAYCAEPQRPRMDRGGLLTYPQSVVACYAAMDAWTQRRLKEMNQAPQIDYPPLFSEDVMRTANDIMTRYFNNGSDSEFRCGGGSAAEVKNLSMSADIYSRMCAKKKTGEPADLFKEPMWWVIDLLDDFYGKQYLTRDIYSRDIFLPQGITYESSVRSMLIAARRSEAHAKLVAANLAVNVNEIRRVDAELGEADRLDPRSAVELDSEGEED